MYVSHAFCVGSAQIAEIQEKLYDEDVYNELILPREPQSSSKTSERHEMHRRTPKRQVDCQLASEEHVSKSTDPNAVEQKAPEDSVSKGVRVSGNNMSSDVSPNPRKARSGFARGFL